MKNITEIKRPDWDEKHMLDALVAATRTSCLVRGVGAVLVRDNRIIATGYNGPSSKAKTCLEYGYCFYKGLAQIDSENGVGDFEVLAEQYKIHCPGVHAEANIVKQCASGNGTSMENSVLYITNYPCPMCVNDNILDTGIKEIVYLNEYIGDGSAGCEHKIAADSLDFAKIPIRQMKISKERLEELFYLIRNTGRRTEYLFDPIQMK